MKFEDSSEQTGVMVEAADGRIFFLPNDKADAFLVSTGDSNVHCALMHAGRSPLGPVRAEAVSGKSDPVAHPSRCAVSAAKAQARFFFDSEARS